MNIVGPRHGCARRAQLELAGFFHSGVLFLSRRSRATSRYRLPPATLTVFVTRYTSLFITRCMSSLHVFVRFFLYEEGRVIKTDIQSKSRRVLSRAGYQPFDTRSQEDVTGPDAGRHP